MRTTTDTPPPAVLSGLVKRYGEVVALDGVDLELPVGEITALLGPNGAGKTTAVRCLLGLTEPDAGTARVFGADPRSAANRRRTGALLQISGAPATLRVGELIHLFSAYYAEPLPAERVIAAAGLAGLEARPFGELSGGQQQRTYFALALCGDPDLLVLDEPTVGLDVESRRTFWAGVRSLVEEGRTVLLTTHYLEEADELADRVVVIDRGSIVAEGSPAEIKARAAAKKIRCRTALPPDRILAVAGIERLRRRGDGIELLTADAESVLRRLLAEDPGLDGLTVTGADLEEAFLHLTGGQPIAGEESEDGRTKGAA